MDTEGIVDARVIPIEMKGRNSSFSETPLESIDEVVDELMKDLCPIFQKEEEAEEQTSYVLFGFSLGAWIALELARRIESSSDDMKNPMIVICAGNRTNHLCSHYYDPDIVVPRIVQLWDAKLFWQAFERSFFGKRSSDATEQIQI